MVLCMQCMHFKRTNKKNWRADQTRQKKVAFPPWQRLKTQAQVAQLDTRKITADKQNMGSTSPLHKVINRYISCCIFFLKPYYNTKETFVALKKKTIQVGSFFHKPTKTYWRFHSPILRPAQWHCPYRKGNHMIWQTPRKIYACCWQKVLPSLSLPQSLMMGGGISLLVGIEEASKDHFGTRTSRQRRICLT